MSSLSRCVRVLWCFVLFLLWNLSLSRSQSFSLASTHRVSRSIIDQVLLRSVGMVFSSALKASKQKLVCMYVYTCVMCMRVSQRHRWIPNDSVYFFLSNVFFKYNKKKKGKENILSGIYRPLRTKKLIIYTYHFFFSFFPAICVSLKKHTRFDASRSHFGFEKLYF